jgi:predicted ATPase
MRYGGHDPCVCIQCIGALTEMMRGHASRSGKLSDDARQLAVKVEHTPTVAHAQWYGAELTQILNRPEHARDLASRVLTVATEKGLSQYAAWAKMMLGWVSTTQGAFAEGLGEIEEGVAALKKTGVVYHLPHRLGMRAQAYALARDYPKAIDAAEEALESVGRTGERWYEAELLRIKAEVLSAAPIADLGAAERCLEAAVATAAGQGALLWESRARIDLAKLLVRHRSTAVAGSVVQPIQAWASDVDLPERDHAKALLERLNAR